MQVADVSQFGDVSSAKSLFVPRGARLTDSHLEKTEPGRRDTGTVAGTVPLPPQTFYRQAPISQSAHYNPLEANLRCQLICTVHCSVRGRDLSVILLQPEAAG